MSVSTWHRKISKTRFIYKLFQLNVRIGQIVFNHPKKYRPNYGDTLIKTGLDALKHACIANSIFMHPSISEHDFKLRRRHLIEAKGLIDYISTVAYVYLELVKSCDGITAEKIFNQEEEIGLASIELAKMFTGVLKSDKRTYNSKKKN